METNYITYSSLYKELFKEQNITEIDFSNVYAIDFGTEKTNNPNFQKNIEKVTKTLNNLVIYDLGIYNPKLNNGKPIIIKFEKNIPLLLYKDEILKYLPYNCYLTAYNGLRMDFIILKNIFGIDTSKYILIDTMFPEKLFNNHKMRVLLCDKDINYGKLELFFKQVSNIKISKRQTIDSLYLDYYGKLFYKNKKHKSDNDAEAHYDILQELVYKYGFTNFNELVNMTNYLRRIEEYNFQKGNEKYILFKNTKFFNKINKEKYQNNNEVILDFGEDKGKKYEQLSDNKLFWFLNGYNNKYHLPYEIQYGLRLEIARRLQILRDKKK